MLCDCGGIPAQVADIAETHILSGCSSLYFSTISIYRDDGDEKNLFSAIKMLQYMRTEKFEEIFENQLNQALDTANNREEAAQITAQNYYHILTSKLPNIKMCNIAIDSEAPYLIAINEKSYEMDVIVRHNDLKSTELLMEIQALWDDADKEKLQAILNELIS